MSVAEVSPTLQGEVGVSGANWASRETRSKGGQSGAPFHCYCSLTMSVYAETGGDWGG